MRRISIRYTFFVVFVACIPVFSMAQKDEIQQEIQQNNEILMESLLEAYETDNELKMQEIVKQAEPSIIYEAVFAIVDGAHSFIAAGPESIEVKEGFDIPLKLAEIYARVHNKDGFFDLIKSYSLYDRKKCQERFSAINLVGEGIKHKFQNQLDTAYNKFRVALAKFQEIEDIKGEGVALVQLSSIHCTREQYNEATEYNEKALAIFQRIDHRAGIYLYYIEKGNILAGSKNLHGALDSYHNALRVVKGTVYSQLLEAPAIYNIGMVYYNSDQFDKSLEYYQKALSICQHLRENYNIDLGIDGDILAKIGLVSYKLQQYPEALENFQKALEAYRKIEDESGEADVLHAIGLIYCGLSQYNKAQEYLRKAYEISKKTENISGQADYFTFMGMIYAERGLYSEALDNYKEALKIYQRIDADTSEADVLISIGTVYNYLDKYTDAIEFCKRANNIYEKHEDISGKAKFFANMGVAYCGFGSYPEALAYCEKSLELFQNIRDDEGKANVLNNRGAIYCQIGKYAEALSDHRMALGIYKKLKNVPGEATSYTNIGNVFRNIGMPDSALENHNKALNKYREFGIVSRECQTLHNIGILYYDFGNYTKALDYYQQSLDISRNMGFESVEAANVGDIGTLYMALRQYGTAIEHFQKSLSIYQRIQDSAGVGRTLLNMGISYELQEKYTEAIDCYQNAFLIFQEIGFRLGEAKISNNIGKIFEKRRMYETALGSYQKAHDIYEDIGSSQGLAISHRNIGIAYFSMHEYENAYKHFQESAIISEQIGSSEGKWNSYHGLARTPWKLGRSEEAVDYYDRAVETIEEMYSQTTGFREEERSAMIGERDMVYLEFIDLLLDLNRESPHRGYAEKSFVISEKAKSRVFQELIRQAGARTVFTGDSAFQEMVQQEQQLRAKLSAYQSRLTDELSNFEKERSQEAAEMPKGEIARIERSLRDLEGLLEEQYPRYADLKKPKALSVDTLQEILKPNETILSYSVGKDKSVAFVINRNSFRLVELDLGREELVNLINKFRQGLDSISIDAQLKRWDPNISYELYQRIFQPLTDELHGVTQLYITADDILYTFPFEALIDRPFDQQAFDEVRKGRTDLFLKKCNTLHYLIDTFTITYLPSASVLRSLRQYPKPGYGKWSKPLIAFADPIFGPEEEKETQAMVISNETALTARILTCSAGTDTSLKRLEASADEAKTIAEEVNGKVKDIYLRERATEDNVYSVDLKAAQYLLFATHGLLGGDFSGVAEPALALTLVDNPPGRDGFLTMSEVLGLDLNAEIIVLSACNTYGRGEKAGSGEGFAGLTRSFMYAGTKSILVTHWSVESQAARDLMIETFRAIKEGSRSDEALWKAKIKMKKSTFLPDKDKLPDYELPRSHPYFWAPFVLVGECR